MIIDDHASITADAGDGIRGYNFGTGNVTITVESDWIVDGARYGVGAFTYDGGHISLTNYGSITGTTDAVDVNVTDGTGPAPSGTATIDNHGHLIGDIAGYNMNFTNASDGDWSMSGTSTFSGSSTITNAGTISTKNGTLRFPHLPHVTGTIEVQLGKPRSWRDDLGNGYLRSTPARPWSHPPARRRIRPCPSVRNRNAEE